MPDERDDLHDRAMRRWDAIWQVEREGRLMSLADRRFVTVKGAQWEGQYALTEDDQPNGEARMEVPKLYRALRRIQSEYRSARKEVDFRPRGGGDDTADALDGLYRADIQDSPGGTTAVDNGFMEGTQGGYGGWRLRSVDEDEADADDDTQRIQREPIYDADQCLFFDPDAKLPDKSDARFAFLLFRLSRETFEEQYPKASAAPIEGDAPDYDWFGSDDVTLAEYFEVDDDSVIRVVMRQKALAATDLKPEDKVYDLSELRDDDDRKTETLKQLEAEGYTEVRRRKVTKRRVRKYLLSGAEVLDSEGLIAGPNIPLVPYFAERSYVDGIERVQGAVRAAVDPQRIYNLLVSKLADASTGPTDSTPIVTPEQIAGHEQVWAGRKTDKPAYLPLNPLLDAEGNPMPAGPIGTVEPPTVPQPLAALLQLMAGDIDTLMGENEQMESVPANTSAQAIALVTDRADLRDYLWQDNLATALKRDGQIWLGMAKDLYVEEGREMRTVGEDGAQGTVKLADEVTDADKGNRTLNDIPSGKWDVVVDVGPASKTRRDATTKAMMGIAQQAATLAAAGNPQAGTIALAALATGIGQYDGEGVGDLRQWVRMMSVQNGWSKPETDEEKAAVAAAQQQEAPPDPNLIAAQAQMALAQAETVKAQTGQVEAQARMITAQASAEKSRAEAVKALASIDQADRAHVLKVLEADRKDARAETEQLLNVVEATRGEERHDRDMMGAMNGDAA